MKKQEIDFGKWVSTDDIDMAMQNIKGVIVLLQGLEFADEAGTHGYQKHGYQVLITALGSSIKDIEKIKLGVDYMDDIARQSYD